MALGTGNLINLAKNFSDEDSARELLEKLRWPNGVACPHCGGADPFRLTAKPTSKAPGRKGLWKCRACRKQFTVRVKTVFEHSHVPLNKWLMAIHLMAASKKGISALQLSRMLAITYKAAWFVNHRLRLAMASEDGLLGMVSGIVEMDETYIGGRRRGTHRGRPGITSHKAPVVALVERGGKVRAMPMPQVTAKNLRAALRANVKPMTTIMTDEYSAYERATMGFGHETVTHSRGEYVRGKASTNTAEGFFSLLKRGINGSFHHVSKAHLFRYVDEFCFRYNNRIALGIDDNERAANLVLGAEGKRLTYKTSSSSSAA